MCVGAPRPAGVCRGAGGQFGVRDPSAGVSAVTRHVPAPGTFAEAAAPVTWCPAAHTANCDVAACPKVGGSIGRWRQTAPSGCAPITDGASHPVTGLVPVSCLAPFPPRSPRCPSPTYTGAVSVQAGSILSHGFANSVRVRGNYRVRHLPDRM